MRTLLAPVLLAAVSVVIAGQHAPAVEISTADEMILISGRLPDGTDSVATVVTGPESGPLELVTRERHLLFWPVVAKYRLTGAPSVYLVDAAAPAGKEIDGAFGMEAVLDRLSVEAEGSEEICRRFWNMQAGRGMYADRRNSIEVDPDGLFRHSVDLPLEAPGGRYLVQVMFFVNGRATGSIDKELLVHRTGPAAWLNSLTEKRPLAYGSAAVGVPVITGLLVSTLLRRGSKH